jgi:hypothetical protein
MRKSARPHLPLVRFSILIAFEIDAVQGEPLGAQPLERLLLVRPRIPASSFQYAPFFLRATLVRKLGGTIVGDSHRTMLGRERGPLGPRLVPRKPLGSRLESLCWESLRERAPIQDAIRREARASDNPPLSNQAEHDNGPPPEGNA